MSSAKWRTFCLGLSVLTLNVRGPSYLGLTMSISYLLMSWLLASPGHQQPWYWLCRRVGLCLIWGRTSTTSVTSMWRNDMKCGYMFMFPLKNLACKGLIESAPLLAPWLLTSCGPDVCWTGLRNNTVFCPSCDVKNTKLIQYLPQYVILTCLTDCSECYDYYVIVLWHQGFTAVVPDTLLLTAGNINCLAAIHGNFQSKCGSVKAGLWSIKFEHGITSLRGAVFQDRVTQSGDKLIDWCEIELTAVSRWDEYLLIYRITCYI